MDKEVEKFWKEYIKADYFEQRDLIKKFPLMEVLLDEGIKKQNTKEFMLVSGLQSYFNDLIMFLQGDNNDDRKNNRKTKR